MGKASTKIDKSIYQLTRENLGYSRQKVADLIAELDGTKYDIFDESRLLKIEYGTVQQRPSEIVTLSKIYNKPELRNYYCCHECEIGKIDAPEVIYSDGIHEILVNMAVSLKNVNHNKIRLMEILEDGKISPDEENDFDKISVELEHISMTIEALQLWCEKMKIKSKCN